MLFLYLHSWRICFHKSRLVVVIPASNTFDHLLSWIWGSNYAWWLGMLRALRVVVFLCQLLASSINENISERNLKNKHLQTHQITYQFYGWCRIILIKEFDQGILNLIRYLNSIWPGGYHCHRWKRALKLSFDPEVKVLLSFSK